MAHDRKGQLARKKSSRQLQNNLYHTAKKDKKRKFHALYDRINRLDILHEAWKKVKANKGFPGVDGKSILDIEAVGISEYLENLSLELKEGKYHAQTVRRFFVPKADGCKRSLGIPTIKDRIVQHLDLYTFQRFRIHFFRRFSSKVKSRGLKFKTWFEYCGIRKFYHVWSLRLSLLQC